ncbi:MAG: phosphonate ABC transporter, permease protein PhnE [Burkholderiales bacterium]
MNAARVVWRPWTLAGGFVIAAAASFAYLDVHWRSILGGEGVQQMAAFAAGFFPPDTSAATLNAVARGAVETLAISVLGTLLAVLAAVALALPASGRHGLILRSLARLGLNVLRAVPELVWAAFMVLAAGLGPLAGCLALAIHTAGVLGRLFAETLENARPEPEQALRESGSAASIAFLYGTLPMVMPQFISYALYRWEYNIRMAAVLGFVGAGGLGQTLFVSLSLFKTNQAATVILAMVGIVAAVDMLSAWLRRNSSRSGM